MAKYNMHQLHSNKLPKSLYDEHAKINETFQFELQNTIYPLNWHSFKEKYKNV